MVNFSNISNLQALVGYEFTGKQIVALKSVGGSDDLTDGYDTTNGTFKGYANSQASAGNVSRVTSVIEGVTLKDSGGNIYGTGTVFVTQSVVNGNLNATKTYKFVLAHNSDGLIVVSVPQSQYIASTNSINTDLSTNTTNTVSYQFYSSNSDPNYTVTAGTPITGAYNADPAPFAARGVACFAAGTAILLVNGEKAVETLAPGDLIITASGAARRVKWVATSVHRPSACLHPHEIHPVRILAGAFGEGLPRRDLRVSPGHAIFVDGVLIPAGHLINGATIVSEEAEWVRYYHVELDSHDVILAEGLPCESYLDDGNRATFANAGESVELHGRLDPKSWEDACAPLVAAGPQLIEARERLHARALELGWTKSDGAELHVAADGAQIAPLHRSGNRFWFVVPACGELAIRSSNSVLAQVLPGIEDHRRLGVAVTEVRIDGATLALDSPLFHEGFHALEQRDDAAWRWTDGDARIGLNCPEPAMVEVQVAMVAPSWKRKAPRLSIVA
jgi:hypothetical protein